MSAPANPLEALPFVQPLQESTALFIGVGTVHAAGFILLAGSAFFLDLRILGVAKALSVRELSRLLRPWSWAGIALLVPSGLLLFLAEPATLLTSKVFQLKMALLLTAGMNAAGFLSGPWTTAKDWDTGVPSPVAARASAAASIVLWAAIVACGRMLPYR